MALRTAAGRPVDVDAPPTIRTQSHDNTTLLAVSTWGTGQ